MPRHLLPRAGWLAGCYLVSGDEVLGQGTLVALQVVPIAEFVHEPSVRLSGRRSSNSLIECVSVSELVNETDVMRDSVCCWVDINR